MPRKARRPLDGATDLLFDQDDDQYLGLRVARVTLGDANAAGFVAEVENEDSNSRLVVQALVDLPTAAGQAGTLDIGVTDTSEESADDIFDALDVNAATGIFSVEEDGGSNGGIMREWGAGEFITVSEASGDADDMVGTVLIFYVDL